MSRWGRAVAGTIGDEVVCGIDMRGVTPEMLRGFARGLPRGLIERFIFASSGTAGSRGYFMKRPLVRRSAADRDPFQDAAAQVLRAPIREEAGGLKSQVSRRKISRFSLRVELTGTEWN
jgi:hypothetical protein